MKNKSQPRNILVIDDEKDICEIIESFLVEKGCSIDYVLLGEDGIEAVKKKKYDVIFQDVMLPGKECGNVLQEIKAVSPESKIVLITGCRLDNKELEELKSKGASTLVTKPFTMKQILESLD